MAMTRLDSNKRRTAIVGTAVPLFGASVTAAIADGDMAPGRALQLAPD